MKDSLHMFHQEQDLAKRCAALHVFDGVSTVESRREGIRQAIKNGNLADRKLVSSRDVTFRVAFKATYGCDL